MQLCTFESSPSVKASQLAAVIWQRMEQISDTHCPWYTTVQEKVLVNMPD